jgi:hypothetical protein
MEKNNMQKENKKWKKCNKKYVPVIGLQSLKLNHSKKNFKLIKFNS